LSGSSSKLSRFLALRYDRKHAGCIDQWASRENARWRSCLFRRTDNPGTEQVLPTIDVSGDPPRVTS
jgi:hypothetical protein